MTLLGILNAIALRNASSETALRALNTKYRERLIREFLTRSRSLRQSPHDVDDLLQIVYERIFRKARTFRGSSEGEAWNWVKALSHRCLLTHVIGMRRRRKFEVFDPLPLGIGDDSDTKASSQVEMIRIFGDFLNPSTLAATEEWLVQFEGNHPEPAQILVYLIQGLAPREIAPLIGRSVHATAQYVYQCRKLALRYRDHMEL